MTARTPRLFEVILPKTGNPADLPPPTSPYFPIYKEGVFIHRATLLGNGLVPFKKVIPEGSNLQSLGENKEGYFDFTAEKLPAHIVGEALAFFRRIYNKHHTEAEVIITKHDETGAYRLFVPYQKVSPMGVTSIYEPTHIQSEYTTIGTLHSHCNMGAFHSGTDTGDASDFDGIHVTLGKISAPEPEIVAMVAMNKVNFHYEPANEVLEYDFAQVYQVPEWWDTYVFPNKVDIEKPESFISITDVEWKTFKDGYGPNHNNQQKKAKWTPAQNGQEMGFKSPWLPKPHQNEKNIQHDWSEGDFMEQYWERMGMMETHRPQLSKESQAFNREREERARKHVQRSDWKKRLEPLDKAIDLASEVGVITSEDWDAIKEANLNDPGAWVSLFAEKIDLLAECIELLDHEVSYNIKAKTPRPQLALPPGFTQTTLDGKETPGL